MKYKFMTDHNGHPRDANNIDYWGHDIEGDYYVAVIEAEDLDDAIAIYDLGYDDVVEVA